MSIIGPRPLLVSYLPWYTEEEKQRHDVRPGLSGLAQVNGRNSVTWEEKFSWDLKYVDRITFLGDVKITLDTVKKAFIKVEGVELNHEGTLGLFWNDRFKRKLFKDNGKLKLLIIVGTRPEIIRLSAVIKKCRKYFDTVLAHTGQNYDYNLNGVFFRDLELDDPEVYLNAVGNDLGETMGNIISESYKLMAEIKPDAVLVLGDTNSCLSVIGAKRLHIPIFHMEAGNRCKDECLPEETNRRIVDIISDVNLAYSEHARRYLADCGLPKERTYVTGSPMAEVLHDNLEKIEASDIHDRLGLEKGKYILLSAHREENIDTEKNFLSLFNAINQIAERYDMPILYSCHPRSKKRLEASNFQLNSKVIQHEPLGFHDYNCLQMHAFAVVSDSGTLPEESSFFTSIGHPFHIVFNLSSCASSKVISAGRIPNSDLATSTLS